MFVWVETVTERMVRRYRRLSLKFVKTQADSCIYTRHSDKGVTIIALYVDDLIIAGSNDDVINDVKRMLNKRYKMKDMGLLDWILGMEVVQNTGSKLIRLKQTRYIQFNRC